MINVEIPQDGNRFGTLTGCSWLWCDAAVKKKIAHISVAVLRSCRIQEEITKLDECNYFQFSLLKA